MKSKIIMLGLAAVLLSSGYVMAEEKGSMKTDTTEKVATDEKESAHTEVSDNVDERIEETIKYCPICGPEEEMHGLALGYKYKGKKYTFCSMGCLKAFKKDPELYLKEEHSGDDGEHGHEGHARD